MNPILDSLSDDVIIIEEQLTCKWNVHVSGSSTLPEFSYEVVSRAIDAWVLEYDETHTFLQLESRPKRTLTERKIDIPPLLLQNRHLSKLIATVEGHLALKFHALPRPSNIDDLLPPTQNLRPEQGQPTGWDVVPHEAPFVSTSSIILACGTEIPKLQHISTLPCSHIRTPILWEKYHYSKTRRSALVEESDV